ncbi:MAG TPA: ABC transporter transmembrane domain-containing protein, partial [Terriglobales bacterium]
IVVQYFGRRIHERFERIQAMFSDISARAQENFSAARVIRAYVQEDAEIANFETANQEYIKRSLSLVRLMGMLWPTLTTLLGFAIVLVLWLGGRQAIQGHITVGEFVAYLQYMFLLTWPMIALGWVIKSSSGARLLWPALAKSCSSSLRWWTAPWTAPPHLPCAEKSSFAASTSPITALPFCAT